MYSTVVEMYDILHDQVQILKVSLPSHRSIKQPHCHESTLISVSLILCGGKGGDQTQTEVPEVYIQ